MRATAKVFALLAVAACGGSGPAKIWVDLDFPDAESLSKARSAQVYLIKPSVQPSCDDLIDGVVSPGSEGYEVDSALDIDNPMGVSSSVFRIEQGGTWVLFAELANAHEKVFLRGCAVFDPAEGDLQIALVDLCARAAELRSDKADDVCSDQSDTCCTCQCWLDDRQVQDPGEPGCVCTSPAAQACEGDLLDEAHACLADQDVCEAEEQQRIEDACMDQSCCEDRSGFIDISGYLTGLDDESATQVSIEVWGAMDALVGAGEPLVSGNSDSDGDFYFDCFDVSGVNVGLVLYAESPTRYYPTYSPLLAYSTPSEASCVEDVQAWAVSLPTMDHIEDLLAFDPAADGLIIGFVLDPDGDPLEDAEVTDEDGSVLAMAAYPTSPDFTDLDPDSATSNCGLFAIPGPQVLSHFSALHANHTFPTFAAAAIPGSVFMLVIQAD
ncbi:MAG: hypothetical protein JXR96_19815 [Deltaproteobacteria bacterium]|nr:hypothetical protein [Deltaproteobacteria bacterium]